MDDPTRSWPMNDIEAPLAHDVVYGRGGLANNHIGNILFRLIVCEYKERYHKSSRHEKTALAECIVRHWRAQSPPGRFLKLDKATDRWNDVRQQARGKASQTFREGPLKMDKLSQEQKDELKKKVEEFVAKISRDSTSLLLPPPPPPSVPAPEDDICETPPQNRSARDLKKLEQEESFSPVSVMDMPFFPVEDVEEAYKTKRQADSAIANFFQSHFPAFPLRRPASKRTASTSASSDKNTASSSNDADEDSKPPPSKKPAYQNPMAAFLGGLLHEKMPHGCNNTISIIPDNAGQQSHPQEEEEIVIFTPEVEPSHPVVTRTTPDTTNTRAPCSDSVTKMPAFDFGGRRQMQPAAAANMPRSRSRSRSRSIERNIHLKKKMLAARRASRSRSIERTRKMVVRDSEPQEAETKMPPLRVESNISTILNDDDDLIDELDMSGRSLTMSSLGLEDLEDDPILFAFCNQVSNHSKSSKTKSKASLDTFSVSSRSSMMDIELEMGSLHELFQEQCDTGGARTTTTTSQQTPHLFEQAYATAGMPGLDEMDDDDMSCISFGDDEDEEYNVMEREVEEDDDNLDARTHHTTLSGLDSLALDGLMMAYGV